MTITFTHDSVPTRASARSDVVVCIRIVQEGLQNALNHGKARNVSVDLTGGFDGIALTIVDDGVGFDVDPHGAAGSG